MPARKTYSFTVNNQQLNYSYAYMTIYDTTRPDMVVVQDKKDKYSYDNETRRDAGVKMFRTSGFEVMDIKTSTT